MNSNKRIPALAIASVCLMQMLAMPAAVLAQTQSVTTTVTTKTTPLAKPVSTTTTTTVVKKRSPHLKRRKGKTARKTSHTKTTTVVTSTSRSSLSGGVAKKHKHRIHSQSGERASSAQQKRSNKLNAFLKTQPTLKKTPYINPPGLDVPSSPAL